MGRGHVMLITTLYDLTSTVTVEALAKGLPIVCLDHCGLAEVVDEKSGIKVPVTTPKRVVNGIAGAIEILAKDERRRQTLAHGALYKAAAFSWQTKIQSLDQIYQRRIESER